MKTLNDLDEETKSMLLLELKRELEHSYLLLAPSREFEKIRLQNSDNNNQISVQTKCILCQSHLPTNVKSMDLIKSYFTGDKKIFSFSCPKCQATKNSKTCRIMRPSMVN